MSAQFYVHPVPDRAAVAQHGMDVRDQVGMAELHRLRPAWRDERPKDGPFVVVKVG